ACNYDETATDECDGDNSCCEYADEFYNCDDECINDIDGDGICNELEVPYITSVLPGYREMNIQWIFDRSMHNSIQNRSTIELLVSNCIENGDGTVTYAIDLQNESDLSGFQFTIDPGTYLTSGAGASGGLAQDMGWLVQIGGNGTVLGFSMQGTVITSQNNFENLTNLTFNTVDESLACESGLQLIDAQPYDEVSIWGITYEFGGHYFNSYECSDGISMDFESCLYNGGSWDSIGLNYIWNPGSNLPYCGDGTCNGDENVNSCYEDCYVPEIISFNIFRDGNLIESEFTGYEYVDTGLSSNTSYCYQITANVGENETELSNEICENTPIIEIFFEPIWTTDSPFLPMNSYIVNATIYEEELGSGDEIGIFDGSNCVGSIKLSGEITNENYVTIFSGMDDPLTPEIDGFIQGNEITYRIWKHETDEEIVIVEPSYLNGVEVFTPQGTSILSLYGMSSENQSISLSEGWNIMSFNIQSVNEGLIDMLDNLILNNQLDKVQDETGNAIEFVEPINQWVDNINDMSITEGYYIRVNENIDLNVTGIRPEYPIEVTLNTGWNILGYPLNYIQSAIDLLQNLLDNDLLIKVQNESGQAIEELPFIGLVNQIGNFEPGEGYYIKVSEEASIIYENNPALSSVVNINTQAISQTFIPQFVGNPFQPMNIFVTGIEGIDISEYSSIEIGLFKGTVCVGNGVYHDETKSFEIIVSGNDPFTEQMDGYNYGDKLLFKSFLNGELIDLHVSWAKDNIDYYLPKGTTVLGLNLLTIPEQFVFHNAYPNPFNPKTTLRYEIPFDTKVSMSVYDIEGRLIVDLVQSFQTAGIYTYSWNADEIPSGLYFVKLSAGQFSQTQKVVIIK
nr:T9SS type A sorting domain-containing protein [Candidatus Pelagibacter sp.]